MALSHLLDTTPPRLLTVAACGGLEPAPDSRLRGTYPHLLHSIAPPFVSAFVAHGRLLKPQPGRPQRTEEGSAAVPLTGLTIHNPFVVLRFTPKRLYIYRRFLSRRAFEMGVVTWGATAISVS